MKLFKTKRERELKQFCKMLGKVCEFDVYDNMIESSDIEEKQITEFEIIVKANNRQFSHVVGKMNPNR